jgi:hypothetical protein
MNQREITSQNLFKAYIEPELEKGKAAVYGEIREWDGVKYQKLNKEWKRVTGTHTHNTEPFNEQDPEAIENYSDDSYKTLNYNLREGIADEREKPLNTALNKLPNFIGTVYRCDHSPWKTFEEHIADFGKGNFITIRDFNSTSKRKVNSYFSFGIGTNKIFYEIEGYSGRDIEKYSNAKGEYEVLFNSKTTYQSGGVKVNKIKDGPHKGEIFSIIVKLKQL